MRNDRLREAIEASGMNIIGLGEAVGVDGKTAQRWVYEGRVPRRTTAERVSLALGVPADWLWPNLENVPLPASGDFQRIYTHRTEVPPRVWRDLITGTQSELDILAVTGLFLGETDPDVVELLRRRAADGVRVRVALADPLGAALRRRGQELLFDSITTRAAAAREFFEPLLSTEGVELRWNGGTIYNSVFRFDRQMLVNQHLYGTLGYIAPTMHLRRVDDAGLFDLYSTSFERAWHRARPDHDHPAAPVSASGVPQTYPPFAERILE
jgi:hypothetical protein